MARFSYETPVKDTNNHPQPGNPNFNLKELLNSQRVVDDPFWQNRDHTQKLLKEQRTSRLDEFNASNSPQRRNQKQKMDPAKMMPAGKSSLERLKQSPYNPGYTSVKVTQYNQNSTPDLSIDNHR